MAGVAESMELNGAPAGLEQIKALALTNFGHFTSMVVEDLRVRGLSLHMRRLALDCRTVFDVDLDTELVQSYVLRALAGNRQAVVTRITVYDPALDLGTIGSDASPHVLVTTRAAGRSPAKPMRLQAVAYRRETPAVKHVGLFGAMRLRRAAQREGFDDVLFINPDGTVSEIATSNIGFVRDGRIVWPRSEYLSGITMSLLQQATDEPVKSEPLTLSDLAGMEAAFGTNAATGIRAVTAVDSTEWSSEHKVLDQLRELYGDIPSEQL
jgi:branched-subunit amino acid aminotransferase/4-amino-4-deoxychorismate lyase